MGWEVVFGFLGVKTIDLTDFCCVRVFSIIVELIFLEVDFGVVGNSNP